MDLGHRRRLLMTLDGCTDQLRSDRLVLVNRHPQRVLHGILAVARRQLQNLQVFAGGDAGAVIAEQLIVGHAEVTGGKHVCVILVILQGARLAHQRVDHVAVIDGVLAIT
jgi:hypothetical protein